MFKTLSKTIISRTISGNDGGYPLYQYSRSTDDNERSTIVKVNQLEIEVDDRWVVLVR